MTFNIYEFIDIIAHLNNNKVSIHDYLSDNKNTSAHVFFDKIISDNCIIENKHPFARHQEMYVSYIQYSSKRLGKPSVSCILTKINNSYSISLYDNDYYLLNDKKIGYFDLFLKEILKQDLKKHPFLYKVISQVALSDQSYQSVKIFSETIKKILPMIKGKTIGDIYELIKDGNCGTMFDVCFRGVNHLNRFDICDLISLLYKKNNGYKNAATTFIFDTITLIHTELIFNQYINKNFSLKYKFLINENTKSLIKIIYKDKTLSVSFKLEVLSKLASINSIDQFEYILNNFINQKYNWNKDYFINLAKSCKAKVINISDNVLVIRIKKFEQSKLLGAVPWCISKDPSIFNRYINKRKYHQYFIYRFNFHVLEEMSLTGISVDTNYKLQESFDKNNRDIIYNIRYDRFYNDLIEKITPSKLRLFIGNFLSSIKELSEK